MNPFPALSSCTIPRPDRLFRHVRSRLRPLDIETEIVDQILDQYGLKLLGLPRNLPVGRRSQNLVLTTSAGKKVLKCYRKKWQASTIVYGHSILDYLSQTDFPAVRLVTTTGGDSYACYGNEYYALFDYVVGNSYANCLLPRSHYRSVAARAGRTLGKFHRQLEGFMPSGRHHLGFESYDKDRWQDIAWQVRSLNALKEKSRHLRRIKDTTHINWLVQNSSQMMAELCRLDEMLAGAPLPRRVIHGDFGLHNILFQKDGTVTLTDFELARLEWRLSDLVLLLPRFRYDGLQRFMAAYQSECPLSSDEWQLLPYVWKFRKLHGVIQAWRSYFEFGGASHKLLTARKHLNQANWALDNRGKLMALERFSRNAP